MNSQQSVQHSTEIPDAGKMIPSSFIVIGRAGERAGPSDIGATKNRLPIT